MYNLLKKILFLFQPETSHKIAETILTNMQKFSPALYLLKASCTYTNPLLTQEIYGKIYANPIGLAGGFDKNASMLSSLEHLGFGFLEYGTLTPLAQPGNEKPRLFRLIKEKSLQNAMGFNNIGHKAIKENLKKYKNISSPLWASIGKNKGTLSQMALEDYRLLLKQMHEFCDCFCINISSPNTPGLRDLQNEEFISQIFSMAKDLSDKPIFLKLSPDMSYQKAIDLSLVAIRHGAGGIIATNTTQDYALSKDAKDFGGLSGEVLKQKSYEFFKAISKELHDKTILVSVGGISDAHEAYERIKLGASLIQIFTSFIYQGPMIAKNINKQLSLMLKNDGFSNISQAIGSYHKANK